MIKLKQKYTTSIILNTISKLKTIFFVIYFCDFLGHSSNPLHSGPKDERRRRVSEKMVVL